MSPPQFFVFICVPSRQNKESLMELYIEIVKSHYKIKAQKYCRNGSLRHKRKRWWESVRFPVPWQGVCDGAFPCGDRIHNHRGVAAPWRTHKTIQTRKTVILSAIMEREIINIGLTFDDLFPNFKQKKKYVRFWKRWAAWPLETALTICFDFLNRKMCSFEDQ